MATSRTAGKKAGDAVKTPQVEKVIAEASRTWDETQAEGAEKDREAEQAEGFGDVWEEERPEEGAADLDSRGRERVFLLRKDGKLLSGIGYGGAGKPVLYWTEKREEAKTWKTVAGVKAAEKKFKAEAVEELTDPVYMVQFLKALK